MRLNTIHLALLAVSSRVYADEAAGGYSFVSSPPHGPPRTSARDTNATTQVFRVDGSKIPLLNATVQDSFIGRLPVITNTSSYVYSGVFVRSTQTDFLTGDLVLVLAK